MSRISCPVLAAKVVAAEEAVAHIHDGDNVGFSGFTGAGYPKAVPAALAATMIRAHEEGRQFQVGLPLGDARRAQRRISARPPRQRQPAHVLRFDRGHRRLDGGPEARLRHRRTARGRPLAARHSRVLAKSLGHA